MSTAGSRPDLRVVADTEPVHGPGPGLRSSIEEGFVAEVSARLRKGELASPARLRKQRIKARRLRVRVVRGGITLAMIGLVGFGWIQLRTHIESSNAELAERLERVEALVTPVAVASIAPSAHESANSASTATTEPPSGATKSSVLPEPPAAQFVSDASSTRSSLTVSADDLNPYTLRRRDTLWTVVGRAYKLNGDQLARAVNLVREINGIENDRRLMPGQKILLPDASLFAQ